MTTTLPPTPPAAEVAPSSGDPTSAGDGGATLDAAPPAGRRPFLRFSLRARITAVALIVVGVVLTIASFGLVQVLQHALLNQIDDGLGADAKVVALAVRNGNAPRNGLPERYVQFVTNKGVIVGTNDAAGSIPVLVGKGPIADPKATRLFTRDDPDLGKLRIIVEPYDTQGAVVLIVARPINQLTDTTRSLTRLLLGGVPLLTAAMGLIVWQMVGRSLRPVERVRTTVNEISAHDLSGRVPSTGTGDEIDRLTTTVNAMLGRLEASMTAEQRFVADASHELRSPIAGMRALLETVPEGEPIPAADRAAVLDALGRLQDLAEQLLLLARGDAMTQAGFRPVDVDEVVLRHASSMRRPAHLVVDTLGVSGGQVLGDPNELARLIENLTSNAMRHARSVVRLGVTETDDHVRIVVADDGPGIAPEDRERVFERFTRLDDARSRDAGGAGLGLAIVSRIVEHHGGTVSIDDAPEGGARFTVDLPSS